MKIPASVFILTKNSAATIRRCLESVKDFEDIVVCDGGSDDGTADAARAYGARIFPQNAICLNNEGKIVDYACGRNDCLSRTKMDWVLYIDADEELTAELAEEIRGIVCGSQPPPHYLWKMPCRAAVDGREVLYSSNYPGYQTRFFHKKSGAKFVKEIHEKLYFDRSNFSVGTLRRHWRYFIPLKKEELFRKFPHYLELEAKRVSRHSFFRRVSLSLKAVLTALKIFLKASRNYVFYGFRDSMPPLIEYSRLKYQLILAKTIVFSRRKRL